MVKNLDTMRSRNDYKRLENHYLEQYENGETPWLKENAIKNFAIINNCYISDKRYEN